MYDSGEGRNHVLLERYFIVEDFIVWVDIETSGLNPAEDSILEVACLITDTKNNLLDEGGYQSTILYSPDAVECMREKADYRVLEMHDCSGLWDRVVEEGLPLRTVENELLEYIQRYAPKAHTAVLGGSSVSLDKAFLQKHMPQITNHLHYRIHDITSIMNMIKWETGWKPTPKKPEHTALSDIKGSIALYQEIREHQKYNTTHR